MRDSRTSRLVTMGSVVTGLALLVTMATACVDQEPVADSLIDIFAGDPPYLGSGPDEADTSLEPILSIYPDDILRWETHPSEFHVLWEAYELRIPNRLRDDLVALLGSGQLWFRINLDGVHYWGIFSSSLGSVPVAYLLLDSPDYPPELYLVSFGDVTPTGENIADAAHREWTDRLRRTSRL